jgi:hypothetical protein
VLGFDDSDLLEEESFSPASGTRRAARDAEEAPLLLLRQRPLPRVLATGLRRIERASTSWEAATITTEVLATTLKARTVLVLAHNEPKSELRIIGAAGAGAMDLLAQTVSTDDFISSAVLMNERSLALSLDADLPRDPERLHTIGVESSLIAVPVISDGTCAGIIEVFDPTGTDGHVIGTVEHVARVVARFLGRL